MKRKIFFYFLFISFSCFSQTGKLTGKLILKDVENYKKVSENTFVILKDGKRIDSIKVDDKLSFSFENLSTDKLQVFTSLTSYPNMIYSIYLKEHEIKSIEIPYTSTCPYSKDRKNVCPTCNKNDKVLPIFYGLLSITKYKDKNGNPTDINGKIISKEEDERVRFISGGCVVSDCQPNWFCQRDQLNF